MSLTLGIAVHRRSACLLVVDTASVRPAVLFERREARPEASSLALVLSSLLESVPVEYRKAPLQVALSSADLACSDAWVLPPGIREAAILKLGPALIESRCAGEELESVALGILAQDGTAQAVALRQAELDEIKKAASGFEITLLSSVPAVLSNLFGSVSFSHSGERIECLKENAVVGWRSFPWDGPDEPGTLSWKGLEVSYSHAAAFAAALSTPDSVPNVLDSTPEAKVAWIRKLRDPVINVAAALALCLGGLAIHFHRSASKDKAELEAIQQAEREVGQRYLPGDPIPAGRLLPLVNERVSEVDAPGGAKNASALGFWEEVGRQFPDVNALGLTLESLDLAPDGGRLSARVPAGKEDPLKNASDLEAQLNRSKKLSARGDYEVKDREVQVRLRMDYRP